MCREAIHYSVWEVSLCLSYIVPTECSPHGIMNGFPTHLLRSILPISKSIFQTALYSKYFMVLWRFIFPTKGSITLQTPANWYTPHPHPSLHRPSSPERQYCRSYSSYPGSPLKTHYSHKNPASRHLPIPPACS